MGEFARRALVCGAARPPEIQDLMVAASAGPYSLPSLPITMNMRQRQSRLAGRGNYFWVAVFTLPENPPAKPFHETQPVLL